MNSDTPYHVTSHRSLSLSKQAILLSATFEEVADAQIDLHAEFDEQKWKHFSMSHISKPRLSQPDD